MEIDINVFWNRVRTLIKLKAATQGQAAEACGVPYNTFRGWMSKCIIPPMDAAFNLALYLGVSVEFLVSGRGEDRESRTNEEVIFLLGKAGEKLKKIRRSIAREAAANRSGALE